jgi:rhodanese-related sulfurtransferase
MNRYLLSGLLILGGASASLSACACDGPAAVAVADLSAADLKSAIAAKTVLLIDANGTDSYIKGHLPGAIDFAANEKTLAKVLPADKAALIVAYCGGPKCGAWKDAADAVAKLGYTNVKHFSGGLKGWSEAGEKLVASVQ